MPHDRRESAGWDKVGAQLAVKGVIGVLHSGGRGDRSDLADALAVVGHGQKLVLFHVDGIYIGDIGSAEKPKRAAVRLRHAVLKRPVLVRA